MSRRVLAYVLAGIPAAIGVAMVARYGYTSSDPEYAATSAAFFGLAAAGAFGLPAYALAVSHKGHKGHKAAAAVLGVLALFAIAGNWLNTLSALADRGARLEASVGKTKDNTADDRAELKRLEGELGKLGTFTPTDAAAVAAAKRAADAATIAKERECAGGEAKARGKLCRDREADEKTATDKLTAATMAKAATDRAAKIETDMEPVRARLSAAPAAPKTNAFGETLGRWLSLPAASAVSLQQGLLALIVELLIAAVLAAPELLRSSVHGAVENDATTGTPAEHGISAPAAEEKPTAPAPEFGSVRRYMMACIARAKGQHTMRTAAYRRYCRWCDEQSPKATPLAIPAFWAEFQPLCEKVGIKMRERKGKVQLVDIQLAA